MEIKTIEDFLRNSIVGIIILGAIGSIIAFYIIKLYHRIYGLISSRSYKYYYIHGYVMGAMSIRKDPVEIQIYIAYHICRFILGIVLTIVFLALFIFLLPARGANLLNIRTYLSILLAILSAIFTYNDFNKIRLAYKNLLTSIFDAAQKAHQKKGQKIEKATSKESDE